MKKNMLKVFAVLELIVVSLIIWKDFVFPTLIIILLMTPLFILYKSKYEQLGFRKPDSFKLVVKVFLLTVFWTLVDIGVLMPILNHLTGDQQNLDMYQKLQGNESMLVFLLVASWTLAAFFEELAYRGLIQNRIRSLLSNRRISIYVAVLLSSGVFGLAHREQGLIGVVVTAIDAVFFSILRYKYNNMWAAILAHGFLNTIGVVTFYFTGPIYALW